MLEQIFMQVIDMSKTASIAILFVLIVRLFLRRFPKYISYGLWIVVFFRLVCPYSFESIISFVPAMKPTSYVSQQNSSEETAFLGAGEIVYQAAEDFIIGEEPIYRKHKPDIDSEGNIIDDTSMFFVISIMLGQYVWVIGIAGMLFYSLYTYINIKEKLITAICVNDNVYTVDNITSPFVMGVIRPKIYLPYGLAEDEQQYILMHEQYHIKRLDYIIKLMAYAVLCIHWFNPLVWLAFVEFSKDMEMSCDEAVVKKSGEEIRANYAASLLNLATEDRIIQSTPLAFGEGDTKSRIKNIAVIKNISFPKVIAIMTLSGIFMLCLAANPKEIETEKLEILTNKIENRYTEYMNCSDYGIFEITNGILVARNASNNFGQLGLNRIDDLDVVYEKIQIAEHVIHFDYNLETLIYLTEDGKLYGIGNNNFGQLGQNIDKYHVGYGYALKATCITRPTLIMENVKYAVLGRSHLLILKNDYSLWGLGRNENNELGIGKKEEIRYYYKPQKIMSNIRYIAASGQNSAAINKKQQLYVWGDNRHSQIARDGKTSNTSMPQLVMRSANSVYFYLNKNGMLHWKVNEPPSKDEMYQEPKEPVAVFNPEEEIILPLEPTKEEVLEKRKIALKGMTDQQRKRLTENIKVYNQRFEQAYMYEDIFGKLEYKDSVYWEHFDKNEDFISFIKEMKAATESDVFKDDLQTMIDEIKLAAETHDMKHANVIFKMLHDMDYFLLRYGIEDVGKYTKNDSVLRKFYGVLSIHGGNIYYN